jgi:exopolysaccharide biosynthesis polyprenyl glycosylphosphotransferase
MIPAAARERTTRDRVAPIAILASEHRLLLASGDTVAAAIAVLVALGLWSIPAGWEFSRAIVREHVSWFAAALLWLVVASLPATPLAIAFSTRRTLAALARGAAILLAMYAAAYFYAPRGVLPRLVVLYFLWEALLLTFGWRLIFIAVMSGDRFRQRGIIIGSGEPAAVALRVLREHRARQVDVIACLREDGGTDPTLADLPAVDAHRLPEMLSRERVSELVLGLSRPPGDELVETLLRCQEGGAQLVRVQTLVEHLQQRVPVRLLNPDWLMTDLADAVRLREASWWAKRAFDIGGGTVGVLLAALLTPFIALAIRLDSGSPIFYAQTRLGRGGAPFRVVKFRTMIKDAERPGQAQWAGPNDPRATRIGRLLRRTRLDELPQFLNVLRGDMSLVGPRPERQAFVERLEEAIPFYRARFMVPPGLTGWAQVNLPYGDSIEAARAKLEFDLYYVKHRSILFDLAIIGRTFGAVLRMGGH